MIWGGRPMLAIIENSLRALRAAQSDAEVAKVLAEAAHAFGFRSAYLIEYAGRLSTVQRVLDTDPVRSGWWTEYFASDLRPSPRDLAASLDSGAAVLRFDASRFGPGSERLRAACEAHDVVDVAVVPISYEGELVGVVGFCGTAKLDHQHETALALLAYSAIAQRRLSRHGAEGKGQVSLTPREREVMRLSADGMTSAEIADQLGMSARTANQHIDNVADKLGTRNRAHTVAEVVRRNLL
jgi:DNA-binding CsgD family transcriptional regulator